MCVKDSRDGKQRFETVLSMAAAIYAARGARDWQCDMSVVGNSIETV